MLNDSTYGYMSQYGKLNHLFYMDDLKNFAKDDDQQQGLLIIVKTFSSDINMEFGLKRMLRPPSKEVALPVLAIFISITLSPSKNWSKKELTNIWG